MCTALRSVYGSHVTKERTTQDRKDSKCPELPLNVVEEILLNLPGQQVICVCRLVCYAWKSVVDSTAFWKERCRREGYKPLNNHRVPKDWRTFFFLCKKRRNLLKNPNAEEEFKDWKIVENGGDRWAVENMFKPHPDETVTKCFVTSYWPCIKAQLINLEKEGYSPAFMDEVQPDIVITDWYAPRWDCGSVYQICVELLNHKKKVIQVFQPEQVTFPQWNDQEWNKMTHVFKDYGPGVRFIHFKHGGKDTQFWAGHYGIRVTNSSVELFPANEE
ncbi:F-box only protein 6-like isoform 1-T1 [Clarias gariepinus]